MTNDIPEVPRKKRKYTKKSKMLLRSNNDYIDHEYWPKMYAQSKQKWAKLEAKYGVKTNSEPRELSELEKKALREQGIGTYHSVPQMRNEPLFRIKIEDET